MSGKSSLGKPSPLSMLELAPETRIPGIIIFSARATPLAGWMSGLELAFVKLDSGKPQRMLLETGASDSWILASIKDCSNPSRSHKDLSQRNRRLSKCILLLCSQLPPPKRLLDFGYCKKLSKTFACYCLLVVDYRLIYKQQTTNNK